ncbi:hypothetical protein [Vibrio caribbeanicus]|uniref:hypothetical protein n=1 Tax=Vibrio caribbeanicus TaxID=701175 RepID=UPI0030D72AE9
MKEINLTDAEKIFGGRRGDNRANDNNFGSGSRLASNGGVARALAYVRGGGDYIYSAQARSNYAEYRERRDRSGDAAARARSRSRSDMNSPGDQRSSDRIGGR